MPKKNKSDEIVAKPKNKETKIEADETSAKKPVLKKSDVKGPQKKTPGVTKEVPSEKNEPQSDSKIPFYFGYGRRKTATARARLYLPNKSVVVNEHSLERGEIYVNDKPIEKYFLGPYAKDLYTEIFRTTNTLNRFITTVRVTGSGASGQLGAAVLAISHALLMVDPKFRSTLRKKGFLTRDPRSRERRKPGLMGARKEKQSPKR